MKIPLSSRPTTRTMEARAPTSTLDTRTTYWAVSSTGSATSTSTTKSGHRQSGSDSSTPTSTHLEDSAASTPPAEWTTTVFEHEPTAQASRVSLLSSPWTLGALAGAAAACALVIGILFIIWWRCRCVRRRKAKRQQQAILDDLIISDPGHNGAKVSSPSFASPGSFGPGHLPYHSIDAAFVSAGGPKRVKFASGYRFDDVLEEKDELMGGPGDTSTESYSPPPSPTKPPRSPLPPLPLSMRTIRPMSSARTIGAPPGPFPPRSAERPPTRASSSTPHLPLSSSPDRRPANRNSEPGHMRNARNGSTASKETMGSQYSTQSGENRRTSFKRLARWRSAYESPRQAPGVPAVPRNPQAFLWRPVNNGSSSSKLSGRPTGRPVSEFGM